MGKYRFVSSSKDQVNWGNNDDPYEAGMVEGDILTLEKREVHTWHTKLYFKGYPGKKFNSASFEHIENGETA